MEYIRDPGEIYRLSFAAIAREIDLEPYDTAMARVVTRLVHACGMPDILQDLAFSPGAVQAGETALDAGAAVHCDVEMVRSGLIAARFPRDVKIGCTLQDPRTGDHAAKSGTTRSAAAVDFWQPLAGSICVIGNAPTALFRLLERIDTGAGTPALIIGVPVGFVGAVESKAELAARPRGCAFITIRGRRGGSAMAASIANALAIR